MKLSAVTGSVSGERRHVWCPAGSYHAGKIIGGGLPIGAFGGRRDIMELVAPRGPVYQAGRFPATRSLLQQELPRSSGFMTIARYTGSLMKRRGLLKNHWSQIEGSFVRLGSMFNWFFRSEPPQNYREVKECDTEAFGQFRERMMDAAIFIPPSQFETNFLSAAHSDQDLSTISRAYRQCL